MQDVKKVSVIIPAYNCEKSIGETILSVQRQTYKTLEIIIINDGSTDKTEQVIKKKANEDERIKYFSQINKGVSAARNEGIRQASGEYITFVDSDDTLNDDAIQTLMEHSGSSDIIIGGIKIIMRTPYGKVWESEYNHNDVAINSNVDIWKNFFWLFEDGCLNSPCARLYKKQVIDDNSVCMDTDLEIGEDLQFNLSFLENSESLRVISGTIYTYHTYRSFLTKKKKENLFDKRKKSAVLLKKHLHKHNLDDNIVYYMFLKLMVSQMMQEYKNKKSFGQRKKIIYDLLSREEIQKSIKLYRPEGLLGHTIKHVIGTKNAIVIDIFSGICLLMSSWLQYTYKRTSV